MYFEWNERNSTYQNLLAATNLVLERPQIKSLSFHLEDLKKRRAIETHYKQKEGSNKYKSRNK